MTTSGEEHPPLLLEEYLRVEHPSDVPHEYDLLDRLAPLSTTLE